MSRNAKSPAGSSRGPSQRQLRLGEMLRHALSEILTRVDIRDDDLKGVFVTVSEVRVSPDARTATAFVLPLGGQNQDAVVAALNRHARFIRGELTPRVTVKYMPTVKFVADTTFDESSRIDSLLRSERVARDIQNKTDE